MTQQPASAKRQPFFVRLGIVVGGLVSVAALVAMAAIAWEKVSAGRGGETYRTYWLVEDSWIGFLIFLACAGVALVIALLFRLKELRELSDLEQRYGKERHG